MKVPKNLQNKAWLAIILSVLFYVIIVILSDIKEIISIFNTVKIEYYLIIFPLAVAADIVRSLRFNLLLKKIGIKLKFKNFYIIFLAGTSMNITPGGLGAIIKSHILKKKIGKSFSSTLPITIYEKWIDLVAIVVIVGAFLFWVDFIESKIVVIIGIIFLSIIFIMFKKETGYNFIKKILNKINFMKRFIVNFDEVNQTSSRLFTKSTTIEVLPLTFLHKVITIAVIFLIFKSFNLDFDIFQSGQIYYTSAMIGALSFIPGGILIVEASLLGLILKTGLTFSVATSLVLTIRFVTIWFHIIVGFVALKIALKEEKLPSENSGG